MKKLWEEKKPIRVNSIGMGFTLIKIDVFKKLWKKQKQLFFFEKNSNFGEDYNFCTLATESNLKIYAHPSSKVGHLAYLPVTLEHFMYNLQNNTEVEDLKKSIFG